MSDEEKYRDLPQNSLHLGEKSGRRQKGHAGEKTASQMGREGTSLQGGGSRTGDEDRTGGSAERESKPSTDAQNRAAKEEKGHDRHDEFKQRSEGTERGGTGPNETLNKV
jgi:hypothetical protein